METMIKKEFKDYPDTTTPLTSEWLNDFQDKIIANFTEINSKLTEINTKLQSCLTYTVVSETSTTSETQSSD